MSNQDRIQARIARSKARKADKRRKLIEEHGNFERVITMQNLHRSLKRRRKGVEWKYSVQQYLSHAIVKMKRAKDALWRGEMPIKKKILRRLIYERGKARLLHPIVIDCRVIQGALCDSCITPLTQPGLIYDNPASTKGKGVRFARERMMKFLATQIRQSGADFWVFLYDFLGYFNSIPHKGCREGMEKCGMDHRLVNLAMHFIKMHLEYEISLWEDGTEKDAALEKLRRDEGQGVTLGSQISQNMALIVPNSLDHLVKDVYGMKRYIRFMDDGNIQHTSKIQLHQAMDAIRQKASDLGLQINEKKTHIIKASKGFTFLKVRYIVTKSGRIIRKISRDSVTRMRRKLVKFRRLVDTGKMNLDEAFSSMSSWMGNAKKIAQTYRQRKRMLKCYNELFHQYRTKGVIA